MRSFTIAVLLLVAFLAKQGAASEQQYDNYYNDEYVDEDDEGDESDNSEPAVILSSPLNITVRMGQTAYLPCAVENLKATVIQWRRGNTGLYLDNLRQTDDLRYTLLKNFTLVINNVTAADSDVFYCQLVDGNNQVLEHRLFVPHPPSIVRLIPSVAPGAHAHIVHKGTPLTLMCEARGYPVPTISWERKGRPMPTGEKEITRSMITIDTVTRKHSGEYICKASNGEGNPARASVHIVVQFEPEIELEKEVVNSAEGYETEISCLVHAHPSAEVIWLKDDSSIKAPPHHIHKSHENNRYILRISGTKREDFGKYTCRAQNKLGSTNKSITVTGNPSTPVLQSIDVDKDNSQVLQWAVESRAPITHYEILYKKQENDVWTTVQPAVQPGSGTTFIVNHTFKSLEPGTYQAKMRAKNNYGWSPLSDVKTFAGEQVAVLEREEKLTESQLLESQPNHNSASQVRISLVFLMSLLAGRFLR